MPEAILPGTFSTKIFASLPKDTHDRDNASSAICPSAAEKMGKQRLKFRTQDTFLLLRTEKSPVLKLCHLRTI